MKAFLSPYGYKYLGSRHKIPIIASHCPNKNLGNYFIDESTSENSSAYSMTEEVLFLATMTSILSTEENYPLYWTNLRAILGLLHQTQKNNTSHQPNRNIN